MDKLLKETLVKAGIDNPEKIKIKIKDESSAGSKENKKLYGHFNDLLSKTVEERKLSPAIHITGEMRALFDKKHRETCEVRLEKQNSRFDLVFYLDQKKYDTTASDILLVNVRRYTKKPWQIHLAVLDILSEGIVNLFAIPKREKIHYTVADGKYVQLQSIHPPNKEEKVVWILESKKLNKKMTLLAEEIKLKSKYIPPITFKELTRAISGPGMLNILFLLDEKEKMQIKELSRVLKRNPFFQNHYFKILENFRFIKKEKDAFKITNFGKEYLKLFA